MSHFVSVTTQVKDTEALVRALVRMGFARTSIEVHQDPQHLYGYKGDQRMQKAHVIIRRASVGQASNDIGFLRQVDGRFVSFISEYDQGRYNAEWQRKLYTFYGVELAKKEYDRYGIRYQEDVDEKQRPRLRAFVEA